MNTYARGYTFIGRYLETKKQFSGVTSRGLKWEDKYIQAKKSIDFGSAKSSSNRPFSSYTNAHFQNEAKRKTFLV